MQRTPDHIPETTAPEGVLEMVCTELVDDPVQMKAYARFSGSVDGFLSLHGLRSWGTLDLEGFLRACARSPSEVAMLCCMLATVLPWMVRAGDVTGAEATALCEAMLEQCAHDAEVLGCIARAKDAVQWQVAAEQRH